MNYIALEKFQNLVGLSDSALVWLLKNSKLQCQIDKDGQLCIDAVATTTEDLVQALTALNEEILQKDMEVISEKLARIIGDEFEKITREALSRHLAKRQEIS